MAIEKPLQSQATKKVVLKTTVFSFDTFLKRKAFGFVKFLLHPLQMQKHHNQTNKKG